MNIKSKIANMVRKMSDDEILDLVGPQLSQIVSTSDTQEINTSTQRKNKKQRCMTNSNKEKLVANIIRVLKQSKRGMAVSEIAEKVEASKPKVASILKAQVADGELYKAGERRFTRYASTPEAAEIAVMHDMNSGKDNQ